MPQKTPPKKTPRTLKAAFFLLSSLSLFFILFSFYAFNVLNATSWNFGGMGMYTTIDNPSNNWLHIYQTNKENKEKEIIDTFALRSAYFKEYESYVSLPTYINAKKLVEKINLNDKETTHVELWTLKYNSKDQYVSKHIKVKHSVSNEFLNQTK